jgi:hypothetical protein
MAQMVSSGTINWYVNSEFDTPELKSPQPCQHGSGCAYYRLDPETDVMVRACCRFVHPGEEGYGRRFFPARVVTIDGATQFQPACVRLVGGAGFYERRRARMSWYDWCQMNGIPHRSHLPDEPHHPVVINSIGAKPVTPERGLVTPDRRPRMNGPPPLIRRRYNMDDMDDNHPPSPGSATAETMEAFDLDLEAGEGRLGRYVKDMDKYFNSPALNELKSSYRVMQEYIAAEWPTLASYD